MKVFDSSEKFIMHIIAQYSRESLVVAYAKSCEATSVFPLFDHTKNTTAMILKVISIDIAAL